jgi:hypothetical protein
MRLDFGECDERERSLGRDDKHAAPDDPEGDDFDDGESHAADEPTAVWDENALRAAGLGDIFKRREPEAPTPAATKSVAPADAPSIVVENAVNEAAGHAPSTVGALRAAGAGNAAATPVPPAPIAASSGGMSWAATVAIAVALGAAAYALIRFLKG